MVERKKWDDNRSQQALQAETNLEDKNINNSVDDDIEKENEHKFVINN